MRSTTAVLAERLTTYVVRHEPGWRLPQPTALARRFGAPLVEVDWAIRQLLDDHLLRRLPDGRLYRTNPVDYIVGFEGLPSPAAYVDPMGAQVSCSQRQVTWSRAPEEVALVLGLVPGARASIIRCRWAVNGQPAAVTTTYLPSQPVLSSSVLDEDVLPEVSLSGITDPTAGLPVAGGNPVVSVPGALHFELQAPHRGVANLLDLKPGATAITMALRFDEADTGRPAGVTVAVLRSEFFRVIIESVASGSPARPSGMLASLAASEAVGASLTEGQAGP